MYSPAFINFLAIARRGTRIRHLTTSTRSLSASMTKSPQDEGGSSPTTPAPRHFWAYWTIEGAENLHGYRPGGYHLVKINDLYANGRYEVVNKLGSGGFATIWLARDHHTKKYVALKICRATSGDHMNREVAALRALTAAGAAVPELYDVFETEGVNGKHPCYAMSVTASSLDDASSGHTFSIEMARAVCARLALIVSTIHSNGYCHGDMRPANILRGFDIELDHLSVEEFQQKFPADGCEVTRDDSRPLGKHVPELAYLSMAELDKEAEKWTIEDARDMVLADLGQASQPETESIRGREHGIPFHYRCPESLMAPDEFMSYSSDVWALACTFWTVLCVRPLFQRLWSGGSSEEAIADQLQKLGTTGFPPTWRRVWQRELTQSEVAAKDDDGYVLPPYQKPGTTFSEQSSRLETEFDSSVHDCRIKSRSMPAFGEAEKQAILSLVRGMLVFDPGHRWDIKQVLASEWMQHWALPALRGPGFSVWPSNIKPNQPDVNGSKCSTNL